MFGYTLGNIDILVTALEKLDQLSHMIQNIMSLHINFKDVSKSVSIMKGETNVPSMNIHLCL